MKKSGLVIAIALLLQASVASAALLYDWTNDPAGTVQTLVDPADVAEGSRDILMLWTASDAANYYFRIDTREAPIQVGGEFSPEVGIQLDLNGAGIGGSAVQSSYIAQNLVGIDSIILSHYTVAGGWVMSHRHNYIGGPPPAVDTTMLPAIGGAFDPTENGGTTLQWSIPKSELAGGLPFTLWGATQDITDPETLDLTIPLVMVPEPTTMAALAIGLLAFARRRRA